MSENLMCSNHKDNSNYRDKWDGVFSTSEDQKADIRKHNQEIQEIQEKQDEEIDDNDSNNGIGSINNPHRLPYNPFLSG